MISYIKIVCFDGTYIVPLSTILEALGMLYSDSSDSVHSISPYLRSYLHCMMIYVAICRAIHTDASHQSVKWCICAKP
jgi:hypothetical protein